MNEEKMQEIENVKRFNAWAEENPCVILISYPRSGREWLWRIMEKVSGKKTARIFDSLELPYSECLFFYWHGYWYKELLSEAALKNIRFVGLMRDLRDCALSDAYRRITTFEYPMKMSSSIIDNAVDDLTDVNIGFGARMQYFLRACPVLQYERMCLCPVAEVQKLIDVHDMKIIYPVDLAVRELDCEKTITLDQSNCPTEQIDLSVKYQSGLDRYKARCLKWRRDNFFRPEHSMQILEKYGELMESCGYTEHGHDMDKLQTGLSDMGTWAIGDSLLQFIRHAIPEGASLLELGSGIGTQELAKTFKMTSIEHYSGWIGLYNSNYIHAPLVDDWYDRTIISRSLGNGYVGILVDGPSGSERRANFIWNVDLFDLSGWIFFDDIHREPECNCFIKLADKCGRQYAMLKDNNGKAFGVIVPESRVWSMLGEQTLDGLMQLVGASEYIPAEHTGERV